MKTLFQLFSAYPKQVSKRYLTKAIYIENQLVNGINYQKLNGSQLRCRPELIRFKLGIYRLIFQLCPDGYKPLYLIKRKNLDRFLKRR